MTKRLIDAAEWSQLAPLLDHALDLGPAAREQYIADLTRRQPEVAARLRELLNEYEQLSQNGFLAKGALLGHPEPPSMAGQRVGAYTIDHLIGRGGMGEVWLATRHDGRFEGRCAIKLLDVTAARKSFAERFRREGRLLARLIHPNIARLIDAGATDDGRPYLVLEYIDGERIDKYCQANIPSIEGRLRLFLDVITAVAHAHANLIIHRDLKPSNVLVARDGTVKLLDFGIAKLLSSEPADHDSAMTHVGEVAFTPDYAAPEQLAGAAASTATDVYQLGLLLYVILTGRHPLPVERVQAMIETEAPRASELAEGNVKQRLSGDLDAILQMTLRKDRNERYPTAAALAADLRCYLNGEPVSARRGGALYRTRKFVGRHKLSVLGSAAAIASLCATLVFALGQAREAARQRDQAQLGAKRADAQNRFMSLAMTEIDAAGKPMTSAEIVASAERLLESHYSDDPRFVVDMLIELSSHYMTLGDRQREHAALAKAEAIARKQSDPLPLARVQCARIDTDISIGHPEWAPAHLAEGQTALARSANRTVGDEVDCLHAQASLNDQSGNTKEAIRVLEQAVALLEARERDHDGRYTSLLSHLTGLYGQVGDTRKEFEAVHKHRLAEQQNYGTETQGLLAAMHNEACALRNFGEIRRAFSQEGEVIQQARRNSASGLAPAFSLVYGGLLIRLDRSQEALAWLQESAAKAAEVSDVYVDADARLWRALALHKLNRDAEADAELDALKSMIAGDPEGMRYEAVLSDIVRAQILASRGDVDAARSRIEPVLTQIRDPNAGLAKLSHKALLTASHIAATQARLAEAESYAREALQIGESHARDTTQSADVGEATLVLAQLKSRLGQHDQAHKLATSASRALDAALGKEHSLTLAAMKLARN